MCHNIIIRNIMKRVLNTLEMNPRVVCFEALEILLMTTVSLHYIPIILVSKNTIFD